jgi:hypothetical protein
MSAAIDVGTLPDRAAWKPYPRRLTVLTAPAVIFDGFDVQIVGFAIPSLMREWGAARGAVAGGGAGVGARPLPRARKRAGRGDEHSSSVGAKRGQNSPGGGPGAGCS